MTPDRSERAPLQFVEAQDLLKDTLEQACRADVYSADTGELIRLEEMLAIADEAAKQAISIKRRIRHDRDRASHSALSGDLPGPPSSPDTDPNAVGHHRRFQDAAGVLWDVRAIYPAPSPGRVRLPAPFQGGWLAFESPVEKRRLSPIPDGWESRSDEALRELCQVAELVPRRSTSGE